MPISAEQHNQRRRAAKAKQVANRVAASKSRKGSSNQGSGSILQTIQKEKRQRQKIKVRSERNGQNLLKQVDQLGMITIRFPKCISDERAFNQYRWNVSDVKRAAKQSNNRYEWHELPNGDFVVAKPKKG